LKFFVIGDEDTVLGFRLAGVEGDVVRTPDEAAQSLDGAFQKPGIGIIIMTERTAESIRPKVDQLVYKSELPLIIEIPDLRGPMEGRKTVKEMIRQAVGVQL
jgi:V/A-type H+/Na+-transporting ATPase subunit F